LSLEKTGPEMDNLGSYFWYLLYLLVFNPAVTINWSNKENQITRFDPVNRNTYRKVHIWRWWCTCEL